MSAHVSPEALERAGVRLLEHLDGLLQAAREGLETLPPTAPESARWQRAAGFLERDGHVVATSLTTLRQDGAPETLVRAAERLRFLARDMDGYDLGFAGDALGRRMETERRLLVMAASQIVTAASGSPASGL